MFPRYVRIYTCTSTDFFGVHILSLMYFHARILTDVQTCMHVLANAFAGTYKFLLLLLLAFCISSFTLLFFTASFSTSSKRFVLTIFNVHTYTSPCTVLTVRFSFSSKISLYLEAFSWICSLALRYVQDSCPYSSYEKN